MLSYIINCLIFLGNLKFMLALAFTIGFIVELYESREWYSFKSWISNIVLAIIAGILYVVIVYCTSEAIPIYFRFFINIILVSITLIIIIIKSKIINTY